MATLLSSLECQQMNWTFNWGCLNELCTDQKYKLHLDPFYLTNFYFPFEFWRIFKTRVTQRASVSWEQYWLSNVLISTWTTTNPGTIGSMQNNDRWRSNQFQPTHSWNTWSNKTDGNLKDSACTSFDWPVGQQYCWPSETERPRGRERYSAVRNENKTKARRVQAHYSALTGYNSA